MSEDGVALTDSIAAVVDTNPSVLQNLDVTVVEEPTGELLNEFHVDWINKAKLPQVRSAVSTLEPRFKEVLSSEANFSRWHKSNLAVQQAEQRRFVSMNFVQFGDRVKFRTPTVPQVRCTPVRQ